MGDDSGVTKGSQAYYVYALLDPREDPPRPFYIGKGVGSRKDQHVTDDKESAKRRRIKEIEEAGYRVETMELVSGLTEDDAYLTEATLIAAIGQESNGGALTNAVQPALVRRPKTDGVKARPGAEDRVQIALNVIKDEIVAMAKLNAAGITNADVANKLGLQSSYKGGQINYLSHSLLGLLMQEERIIKSDDEPRYWSPGNYKRRLASQA